MRTKFAASCRRCGDRRDLACLTGSRGRRIGIPAAARRRLAGACLWTDRRRGHAKNGADELAALKAMTAKRTADDLARFRWWATGGPVHRWNEIILDEMQDSFVTLPLAARHLALFHAALDDAVAVARHNTRRPGRATTSTPRSPARSRQMRPRRPSMRRPQPRRPMCSPISSRRAPRNSPPRPKRRCRCA